MLSLARWTGDHRRLVVVVWIVVLVGAMGLSSAVGTKYGNNFTLPGTDAQRAADLLSSRFRAQAGDADQIVFHARSGTLADPVVRRRVQAVLARVGSLPHVESVVSPYATRGQAISKDETIGFATVYFDKRANVLPKPAIRRVITTARSAATQRLQVELNGQAIEQAAMGGIGYTFLVGIGAAVVVLLISFGSLLSMGLPVGTALLGLGTGVGLIGLFSRVLAMPDFASQLALMIGLGVGIDYALFIVTRYREAYRRNGGDLRAAVGEAMNTAGRAVIFAGTTVVIALLGMFALGIGLLNGLAVSAAIAVLLVLAASLTLLPALLTFFGHRIGRLGWLARRRAEPPPDRSTFWTRWIDAIQRHPWIALVASTAVVLLLAAPLLGLRLGNSDAGNDPTRQTTRRAYDLVAQGFGKGFSGPLLVAVKLPHAGDTATLAPMVAALRQTPGVAAVAPPRISPSGDAATIAAYPTTSPQSSQTEQLVKHLRRDVIPPIEHKTGAVAYIGGTTAAQIDFNHVLGGRLPYFIGVVVLLSALLLLLVFRSLLIPLQAALMNLLSIGAAMGIIVAVFQYGWLGSLFGIAGGPIFAFLPVMVFAIVFGLSMDYEVFLISRIHEEWTHGRDNSAAVREGLIRTGRVITAAAAVMVVVFASFIGGGQRVIEMFGLALASAVALDALVIRVLMLPATLQLLGKNTWYFPRWLDQRLPRFALEPPEDTSPPPKATVPPPTERPAATLESTRV
jgi:RND superfamily putative drug exporter